MPYTWVTMSNTPAPWNEVSHDPRQFRDAVERTVEHFNGKLEHMFWAVNEHRSYALVDIPHDPVKLKAMLRALPTIAMHPMLDHAEAQKAFDHGKAAPKPTQA